MKRWSKQRITRSIERVVAMLPEAGLSARLDSVWQRCKESEYVLTDAGGNCILAHLRFHSPRWIDCRLPSGIRSTFDAEQLDLLARLVAADWLYRSYPAKARSACKAGNGSRPDKKSRPERSCND